MKTRAILYVITLLAYTLSLAHSVIPHHHHESTEEALSHTHSDDHHHGHDHTKSHDHEGEQKSYDESETTGHLFFFTHDVNADIFISHSDIAKPLKGKTVQINLPSVLQLTSFEMSAHLVFHPPQSDDRVSFFIASSRSLRAPPSFFA